ncbi:MAG TPA: hypothetical protein VFS21_16040 [Roseiflexaceae bacterium]|nr:hypothetical protein [Roseiflexaceae bacterium]
MSQHPTDDQAEPLNDTALTVHVALIIDLTQAEFAALERAVAEWRAKLEAQRHPFLALLPMGRWGREDHIRAIVRWWLRRRIRRGL